MREGHKRILTRMEDDIKYKKDDLFGLLYRGYKPPASGDKLGELNAIISDLRNRGFILEKGGFFTKTVSGSTKTRIIEEAEMSRRNRIRSRYR